MKKPLAIGIFCAMAAVIVGLGIYAASLDSRLDGAGRINSSRADAAMGEFAGALAELDETMRASRYAAGSTLQSTLCAEAASDAAAASAALAALPYATEELETLAHYLNGVGDYMLSLSRETAAGRTLTEAEHENLLALGEAAAELSLETGGIYAALDSGELIMDEYAARSEDEAEGTVGAALAKIDAALGGFPRLEYAGQYSAAALSADYGYLNGRGDVSEDEAKEIAAAFLGVDAAELSSGGRSAGSREVYTFSLAEPERHIAVSVPGGVVLTVSGQCSGGEKRTDAEAARQSAEELAADTLGEAFETVSVDERAGIYEFTLAPLLGETLLISDAVRVSIDASTGELCAWDASAFAMNHVPRGDLSPALTAEAAAESLSAELESEAARLVLTETYGGDEALCWEFACSDGEGQRLFVFIDAKMGNERKIELA